MGSRVTLLLYLQNICQGRKTMRDKKRLKDMVKYGEDEAALQKKIDAFVMTYFLRAL